MNVLLVALLVTAGKVLDFCRAHTLDVPAVKDLTDRLAALVARAQALGQSVEQGVSLREWANAQKETMDRQIRYYLLRPVAIFADVIYKHDPVRAAQFSVPRRGSGKKATFLVRARTVLGNLNDNLGAFLAAGLSPALPAALTKALDDFAALPETSNSGDRSAGLARKGLGDVGEEIMDILKELDAVHRVHLQADATLFKQWREARTIPWPKARKRSAKPKDQAQPDDKTGAT